MPADGVISGLLVLISGVLLVTPGVMTDVFGLSLLIPGIRRRAANAIRKNFEGRLARGEISVASTGFSAGFGSGFPGPTVTEDVRAPQPGEVIDAEVVEATPRAAEPVEAPSHNAN